MKGESVIKKIEENWLFASRKLNFEIVCPFLIKSEGIEKKVFAFLPTYGSKNGMIIDFIYPPDFYIDTKIINLAKKNGYYYSFINPDKFLIYNEGNFMEALEDWGNFMELK